MGPQTAEHAPGQQTAISADRIFDGYRWHNDAVILIDQGLVLCVQPRDRAGGGPTEVMPPGTLLAPGFIDLQINGGGGILLNDSPTPEAMRAIARAHRRYGTTSCLPTLISDSRSKMKTAIAAAKSSAGTDGILGLHLEGPFISPARPGIHRRDLILSATREDLDWLVELAAVGSSLVTLAPECVPGGFIKTLASSGIRVSVGHSEATSDTLSAAIVDGLSGVTHLFNAMPAMSAREPGIVGVALTDARLTAGIILDGIHVDPLVARAAFAAKDRTNIALVSDAMPTVGTEQDHFDLMGRRIHLRNGRLVSEQGTLAGAHLNMASAVKNAVTLIGICLDDALRAASLVPARFLGIEHHRGALRAGARADIVALTANLDVVATWMAGKRA
ncbi:N-acetylglucosamine-6-phosphate deacetylase [Bradyrhizobium sp.]|jgi:N-acetylglucosamine-6-phosphate deacetylase|uniref:N-acetylglucosamine-6-phosphate deacetylase n=1 Tax=Bradyrhizobium sp. TaxID=376 RepID=UPI002E0B2530|nr:N-acetylglucosamine-6-phosphate deacetylase [Bradyrhizobium sp.]